jgi:hypothetical protein
VLSGAWENVPDHIRIDVFYNKISHVVDRAPPTYVFLSGGKIIAWWMTPCWLDKQWVELADEVYVTFGVSVSVLCSLHDTCVRPTVQISTAQATRKVTFPCYMDEHRSAGGEMGKTEYEVTNLHMGIQRHWAWDSPHT